MSKKKMLVITITPEDYKMETINGSCKDSDKILDELKKMGIIKQEIKSNKRDEYESISQSKSEKINTEA